MYKLSFGNPINSDGIVNIDHITTITKNGLVPFLKVEDKDGFSISYTMDSRDIVYGLGENVGGINKRGGIYESFCSDESRHTPDRKSLYAAHNFILVDGERLFGLFIDHPGKVTFDIGFKNKNIINISTEQTDFDLYYIEGKSKKDIVKKFRIAIGHSFTPPKWAFGFQQSRWSYPDSLSIEELSDKFIKNRIPCDSIYLDIDYMDNFKNFTVDETKFPEFPKFVKTMKEKGFRLIPIIDAGCKKEVGYNINDEGLKNNYFCVDKDGKPFVGAVWPGLVHFPDFLNPEVRTWFGDKYNFLIDQGIEGFWNDMNEPAIFYSETGLKQLYEKIEESKGLNLDIYSFFELRNSFNKVSNSLEDYKSFYHKIGNELINHYDVHNLYGYNMTRAASESFNNNYPNKRFLLFSRASAVGMHRYGGIWTGDNHSWWEHLLLNIKMMPSLNMLGFLYSGADIGGFGSDASGELIIRWTQFGIFTPLLRNHSVMGSRYQEGFSFDDETTDIFRDTINLRYALIPYIYSEFMKSAINNDSYITPLSFDFSDEISKRVEDQLLVGDSLMVTPIYSPNQLGRNVWLPEDMLLWKVKNYTEFDCTILKSGHRYIDVDLDQVPIFIRNNSILIVGNHGKNVEAIINNRVKLLAFIESSASYTLYDDDGSSNNYTNGDFSELNINIKKLEDKKVDISINIKGRNTIKIIDYTIFFKDGSSLKGEYKL